MRSSRITLLATAVAVIGTALMAPAAGAASRTSPADTAIRAAARQQRYAFVTFFKKDDAASARMLADAKRLQGKYSSRASFVSVDVDSPSDRSVVAQYGADRSPIPLTVVIAPNGAVTAGFPSKINKTDLSDVFVSPGQAEVLRVIQGGRVAVISIQNSKTRYNKESIAAAEALRADKRFASAVEIVKIDPSDRRESGFMRQCAVDTGSGNAQLVMIAPPGRVIGKFDGATSKAALASSLTKATSGCSGAAGCCGK